MTVTQRAETRLRTDATAAVLADKGKACSPSSGSHPKAIWFLVIPFRPHPSEELDDELDDDEELDATALDEEAVLEAA